MKNNRRLVSILLVVFIDLLGFSLILPLLPYYAKTFQASDIQVGLLVAIYAAAQLVGAPVLGRLSDRYGRRPVLLISIAGNALGYVLLGLANSILMLFAARLLESLDKLAKRLGGSLHQTLRGVMQRALLAQKETGDVDLHRDWIAVLMRQYYDPMYAYQRSSRVERIRFEGDRLEVLAFLREQSA